jgi:hypothetical protein
MNPALPERVETTLHTSTQKAYLNTYQMYEEITRERIGHPSLVPGLHSASSSETCLHEWVLRVQNLYLQDERGSIRWSHASVAGIT